MTENGSAAQGFLFYYIQKLFQKHAHQFVIQFGVWLIPHGQIQPGLFIHNAFVMGEGIKANLAMVRTHAAGSGAAKAHMGSCQMNDGVIDTAAAKGTVFRNLFNGFFVFRKQIKGKGMGMGINFLQCLLHL